MRERNRRILYYRDVACVGSDQACNAGIRLVNGLDLSIGCLVASDLCLQGKVAKDGVAHCAGDERRSGVVEVDQTGAAGRIRAPACQVLRKGVGYRAIHAPSSSIPRCQWWLKRRPAVSRSLRLSASMTRAWCWVERLTRPASRR
jgi:hypothetical protein